MTNLPTQEQQTWLKEYYRMYSRYHLAIKLGISEKVLSEWLTHLGLKKKKDAKRVVLSDEDKKFIENNFHNLTHEKIAQQLNVKVGVIQRYCAAKRLLKKGPDKYQPPPKKIIPYKAPVKPQYERPPTTYSAGYDATIDKYLKMDL